jgi:hypothetical protein
MTVLLDGWVDQNGNHHSISRYSLLELVPWRGYKTRIRGALEMYCPDCHYGVHVYQIGKSSTLGVRHNPGRRGQCEYEDTYNRFRTGMSHEHKATATRIVTATRKHKGWAAEPEWRLPAGDARADVYAWHQKPTQQYQRPIVWEVQMSRQAYAETAQRTAQRATAAEGARTLWMTSHVDTVTRTLADPRPAAPVWGIIVDPKGERVVERAYSSLEPRIPLDITVTEAVKGLIRPTNRLTLIPWRDDDEPCNILIPESAASSAEPRRREQRPTKPGRVVARGCDRTIDLQDAEPPAPLFDFVRPAPPRPPAPLEPLTFERAQPTLPEGPRISCPDCGDDMADYVIDVHRALRHTQAATR